MKTGYDLITKPVKRTTMADPSWINGPDEQPATPETVTCGNCYGNGVEYAGVLNGFTTCPVCDGEKWLNADDCDETYLEDGEWYGIKAG